MQVPPDAEPVHDDQRRQQRADGHPPPPAADVEQPVAEDDGRGHVHGVGHHGDQGQEDGQDADGFVVLLQEVFLEGREGRTVVGVVGGRPGGLEFGALLIEE